LGLVIRAFAGILRRVMRGLMSLLKPDGRFVLLTALCLSAGLMGCVTLEPSPVTGVQISSQAGKLSVSIDGLPFTEYRFNGVPKPCLYPLTGPTGDGMTRNYPFNNPPGEEHDHPHHRSVWFGHGSVNGVDFWTESSGTGRIVHDKFTAIRGGQNKGIIASHNRWVRPDGQVVCTDDRTLTFYKTPATVRMFDVEITLHADHGDLVLGDTKEGTMAIRVAESMRVTRADGSRNPSAHIVNSEGVRDLEAWGKRARWCDYSGLVNGRPAGIAIFDHPQNPRFPTWWMVRDYGLFAANPFGQHAFEKLSDAHVGDLKIAAGGSVTFRYRVLLHTGTADQAGLAERYQEFVGNGGE
jgi:hypothetical protein